MDKDIQFRFFQSREDKKRFINLLKWNRLENKTKRILVDGRPDMVNLFKFTNNEEKTSLVYYSLKPMVTHKSAFIKSTILAHVTYRKGTKKLWVSNLNTLKEFLSINHTIMDGSPYATVNILKILKLEALNLDRTYNIMPYITNVTARAIITGRCTSFTNLVKRYYSSIGIKNITMKRAISMNKVFYGARKCLYVAKNKENFFKFWDGRSKLPIIVRDTVDMAFTLQQKVDFKWSDKRFKVEHDKMANEILVIKLKGLENRHINYGCLTFPDINGLSMLTSSHDFIKESELMNHCVGTSNTYFNKAERYDSILLRYNRLGFRGTVEVGLQKLKNRERKFSLIQFYGLGDCTPPTVNYNDMRELIASDELIPFMTDVLNLKNSNNAINHRDGYLGGWTTPAITTINDDMPF